MTRAFHGFTLALLFLAANGQAAPPAEQPLLSIEVEPDLPLAPDRQAGAVRKVLADTSWIADWSFDVSGGGCSDAGWIQYDNRIRNDGSNYWFVDGRHSGFGGITGNAAILSKHDLTWVYPQGYGNDWDYSIVLKYQGASTLAFDFLSDSDPGFDFVTVELDSAGASESRVDYSLDPKAAPEQFRVQVFVADGYQMAHVGPLALADFGVPATLHEAYIRFESNGVNSDEDGGRAFGSFWAAGLVVDNIAVTGAIPYTEDFEGTLNANVTFANTAPATPFGMWARLYSHITDNDKCTENTTCAWLWTDPLVSAVSPDMAFGPGGAVVHNWLDDIVVSPWVSLASTPGAVATFLSYRRFSGNTFNGSRIVQNWSLRSKVRIDNTDTSALGDSIDAVTPWAHATNWNSLTDFKWTTQLAWDLGTYIEPGASAVQVRFRVSDWQYIAGVAPPTTFDPGPGPFIDRVRIGRRVLSGPVFIEGIDSRSQAQDCFPTYRNSILPGEHFWPTTDRFGSCAFSMGQELSIDHTALRLITGDSIWVEAKDARGAGGISSVRWYGAVVSGPHAGKAPAPWTVGANGFFEVTPDSARRSSGSVVADRWFVDFDDTYFRGGDVLLYFWTAADVLGGFTSDPEGLGGVPGSVAEAEGATGGLFEVSFLPAIDWDPGYLARIAADPHGKLEPTPAELAGSQQASCILYSQLVNSRRRSSPANRTSFMYTLDRLGYRGHYDVYDHMGFGNTGNHLAGRATVEQMTGYAVVVHDCGRQPYCLVPEYVELSCGKYDQGSWFQSYLAQGLSSEIGTAALWLVGANILEEHPTMPLFTTDMGASLVTGNETVAANPDVEGVASFTWADGATSDFSGSRFALEGLCPTTYLVPSFDGLEATGTSVVTHRYRSQAAVGDGAVVMNRNSALHWNSVLCGFAWSDIREGTGDAPSAPHLALAGEILGGVLPASCQQGLDPTGVPPETQLDSRPARTVLRGNAPNPFNPTTSIRFDLAREGRVEIVLFDVAGRQVRRVADAIYPAGQHAVTWNGFDDRGVRVATGIYVCRMRSGDYVGQRKMMLVQ